jgi:hypothetical protein
MRVTLGFYGAALALAFLASGCGGGDPGMKEFLSGFKDAIETMKSIKDEASAKAANDKLKATADKMEAGAKQAKGWTDSQKKEFGELSKQFEEEEKRIKGLGEPVVKACADGTTKVGIGVAVVGLMDMMMKEGKK